jgi:glucosylceramidase
MAARLPGRRLPVISGLIATSLVCGTLFAMRVTGAQAADTPVQIWMTTTDGARRLTRLGDTAFTARLPQSAQIEVDAGIRHQEIAGFGASITEASSHLIMGLPPDARARLVDDLFNPSTGIGLNYLRQPMGGTDFVAALPYYTYDDGTTPDPGLTRFSIDRDRAEILPVLRQALAAAGGGIRVIASPWSAPAWMKDGGSLLGGSLRPEYHDAYAAYFVRFIRAYAAAGVPVGEVTPQNEPLFTTGYPSMSMSSAQAATFIRALDRALGAAGLSTRILAYDHNWDRPDYPLDVFARTEGVSRLIGAAFHCYGGQPEAQNQIRQAGKQVYFTECSGIDTGASTFADTLRWQTENLIIRTIRSGASTVLLWNLALDQRGGPHFGNCGSACNGVVEIAGGTYSRNAEYYVLGHVSRFVRRGAVRIESTARGAGGLLSVAFQNPDGSRVLLVHNSAGGGQPFSVVESGRSFAIDLPAGAVATLTWPGAPGGGEPDPVALDRAGWVVSASASPSDPCCTGDVPAKAIDGDAGSRWSTGRAQEPGQWFTVDLGRVQAFRRIVLDAGSSTGDQPRGYAVYVSNDPQAWGNPVATGAGEGRVVTVDLASTSVRYLRVVQTGWAGNWWSIHELNLYR